MFINSIAIKCFPLGRKPVCSLSFIHLPLSYFRRNLNSIQNSVVPDTPIDLIISFDTCHGRWILTDTLISGSSNYWHLTLNLPLVLLTYHIGSFPYVQYTSFHRENDIIITLITWRRKQHFPPNCWCLYTILRRFNLDYLKLYIKCCCKFNKVLHLQTWDTSVHLSFLRSPQFVTTYRGWGKLKCCVIGIFSSQIFTGHNWG